MPINMITLFFALRISDAQHALAMVRFVGVGYGSESDFGPTTTNRLTVRLIKNLVGPRVYNNKASEPAVRRKCMAAMPSRLHSICLTFNLTSSVG